MIIEIGIRVHLLGITNSFDDQAQRFSAVAHTSKQEDHFGYTITVDTDFIRLTCKSNMLAHGEGKGPFPDCKKCFSSKSPSACWARTQHTGPPKSVDKE